MGVERLRDAGIETAFVTRENSPIVARRAEKLKIRLCYLGVRDKAAALPTLLAEAGVTAGEVAYIGDDVNDCGIMAHDRARGPARGARRRVRAGAAQRALPLRAARRPRRVPGLRGMDPRVSETDEEVNMKSTAATESRHSCAC